MRSICVVTGSRADYGLLRPLLTTLDQNADCRLCLVVTGSHLSHQFGLTLQEIQEDGFSIQEQVVSLVDGDDYASMTKSVGLGVISFADSFKRLDPDAVLVLGDRFEIFASATAAYLMGIPVIHLHGGEITLGAIDDGLRNAITQLSSLHFASTDYYRERIIAMGGNSLSVWNVGAFGLEGLLEEKIPREQLEKDLDLSLDAPTFLVTIHSETRDVRALGNLECLLRALDCFDAQIIFTGVNSDPGSRAINESLEHFKSQDPSKRYLFTSLGQRRYLSLMNYASLVLGNSSSGIIEAPSLGVPTINLGDRQAGRIRPPSVIDCDFEESEIREGISKALSRDFLTSVCSKKINPYFKENTAENTARIIMSADLNTLENAKR